MLKHLDDDMLSAVTRDLVGAERQATATLLEHLAEFESRRLHLKEGFPSLFKYLVDGLNYSEPAASRRVTATRVVRQHPVVLTYLAEGKIHLSAIQLIASHLETNPGLIEQVLGKGKAQIEVMVARLGYTPLAPQREVVRIFPGPALFAERSGSQENNAAHFSSVAPEKVSEVRLSITLDEETYAALKRAQDVSGEDSISDVMKKVLEVYLKAKDPIEKARRNVGKVERLPPAKVAAKSGSRYISQAVKHKTQLRDKGQCAYVDPKTGRRCQERKRLQYDHITPMAKNGSSSTENVRLLCRPHNIYAARNALGDDVMDKFCKV